MAIANFQFERGKRVSKKSRVAVLVVEDWRTPLLTLAQLKSCFNGKGLHVMTAKFINFDQPNKKSKARK